MRTAVVALICSLFMATFAGPADARAADVVGRFGWGDRLRQERWTPAFVTARADQVTPATLEWYVPRPGREAMIVRQSVTLNPSPRTFPAYLPVGPDPAAVHVRVADARTNRTLGVWPPAPLSPTFYADRQVRQPVFVGTSGVGPSLRFLDDQTFAVAFLPKSDLPRRAVGYDALDVLALDRPDLARMEAEQQESVVAWVRSGGTLVIYTGVDAVPAGSAVGAILPGEVAEVTTREVAGRESAYVRLQGVDGEPLVTTIDRGLGRVVYLHAPPADSHDAGESFVPAEPRATLPVPTLPPEAVTPPADGVPAWLWPALAVAFVAGPVDWFVLRRTGRRGRRWATLPGWVAAVALLVFAVPSSRPETLAAEASVVDGPDAAPVAATARLAGGGDAFDDDDDGEALLRLQSVGPVYWKTLGFDRTAGPIRDVLTFQDDRGMDVQRRGRANLQALAIPQ